MQDYLDFSATKPVISDHEIEAVCDFLSGKNWVKSSQIGAALNIDERRIRAIAEQSNGRILSGPGCPGYKLLSCASQIREVDECSNRLESQAKRMLARAHAYRRRAHMLISS